MSFDEVSHAADGVGAAFAMGDEHGRTHDPSVTTADAVLSDAETTVAEIAGAATVGAGVRDGRDWREIDRQLRRIARRRAGLDVEEARWILAARRAQVHAAFGYATFIEYLERVLGYGPRVAIDRLRIAEALELLPATRAALATGATAYSTVRELTRVAIGDTEDAWLAAAAGRTVREVEMLVAGHRRGDLPGDPTDPDLRPRILRFEVLPSTFALFRDVERHLKAELGHMPTDDELLATMCQAVLVPPVSPTPGEPAGAGPHYQIALTVCAACERGWQDGGGQPIEVSPVVIETAQCDAQEIGWITARVPTWAATAPAASADQPDPASVPTSAGASTAGTAASAAHRDPSSVPTWAAASEHRLAASGGALEEEAPSAALGPPEARDRSSAPDPGSQAAARPRATRTIPPATRRLVLRRDHGRCVVPGCRSTRWIDVHHILPRAQGGGHDAANLIALCGGHHRALHAGALVITGRPGDLRFTHDDGRPWGAPPTRDVALRDSDLVDRDDDSDGAGGAAAAADAAADGNLDQDHDSDRDSHGEGDRDDGGGHDDGVRSHGRALDEARGVGASAHHQDVLVAGALRKLGFTAGEAAEAVARARAHVGTEASIDDRLRAALRSLHRAEAVRGPG